MSECVWPMFSSRSFTVSGLKNRIASLCLTQETACWGLVHGDDPERCYGEGGGRGGSCLGMHVRIKDFKI